MVYVVTKYIDTYPIAMLERVEGLRIKWSFINNSLL